MARVSARAAPRRNPSEPRHSGRRWQGSTVRTSTRCRRRDRRQRRADAGRPPPVPVAAGVLSGHRRSRAADLPVPERGHRLPQPHRRGLGDQVVALAPDRLSPRVAVTAVAEAALSLLRSRAEHVSPSAVCAGLVRYTPRPCAYSSSVSSLPRSFQAAVIARLARQRPSRQVPAKQL